MHGLVPGLVTHIRSITSLLAYTCMICYNFSVSCAPFLSCLNLIATQCSACYFGDVSEMIMLHIEAVSISESADQKG